MNTKTDKVLNKEPKDAIADEQADKPLNRKQLVQDMLKELEGIDTEEMLDTMRGRRLFRIMALVYDLDEYDVQRTFYSYDNIPLAKRAIRRGNFLKDAKKFEQAEDSASSNKITMRAVDRIMRSL